MVSSDHKSLNRQIKLDGNRFTWKPSEIEDNIFELLATARRVYNVRLVGIPYDINDETVAIDVEPM